jgi:hypothetical protein
VAIAYLSVAVIGACVGLGELVARYRDAPARAVRNPPALLYIMVNAAASALALGMIDAFDWTFGVEGGGDKLRWTQTLIAGFGAMAFLRSAVLVVRVGDQDVGVGPSGFLQVILNATDRAVDRLRAGSRAGEVTRAMRGISFARSWAALPTYCLALMQNASKEEEAALADQVALLRAASMDDRAKGLALGLALMNVVGIEVLEAAIASLGDEIRHGDEEPPDTGRT